MQHLYLFFNNFCPCFLCSYYSLSDFVYFILSWSPFLSDQGFVFLTSHMIWNFAAFIFPFLKTLLFNFLILASSVSSFSVWLLFDAGLTNNKAAAHVMFIYQSCRRTEAFSLASNAGFPPALSCCIADSRQRHDVSHFLSKLFSLKANLNTPESTPRVSLDEHLQLYTSSS